MELVIALLSGAAGGSLISGMSPKVSVNIWASMLGGMAGGGVLHLIFAKLLMPGGAKVADSVDIYSLLALLVIGFAGGVLVILPIFVKRWRQIRQ